MMVTRQFARDHDLALPEGMFPDAGRDRRKKSLSLYEKHQQEATGLTKEDRIAQVTHAWRHSDGARAFVRAIEELGYVLATGKRPYVLVDLYGEMNSLPKLIDDRQVRTKDIRAFLEREFPPESLPRVEEAKALVAGHRKAIEDFGKAQARADRVGSLKASQGERRRLLEDERSEMQARHSEERNDLALRQRETRRALEEAHEAETKRVGLQREQGRSTGLVAVLARVSGFDALRRQLRRHQDKRRQERFVDELQALDQPQAQARLELQRRHEAQSLDLDRQRRALEQVEARELKSLETKLLRERRIAERARGDGNRMPALAWRAKNRHPSRVALEETGQASPELLQKPTTIREEFTRVAGGDNAHGGGAGAGGSSDGGTPPPPTKPRDPSRKRRDRHRDRDDWER